MHCVGAVSNMAVLLRQRRGGWVGVLFWSACARVEGVQQSTGARVEGVQQSTGARAPLPEPANGIGDEGIAGHNVCRD